MPRKADYLSLSLPRSDVTLVFVDLVCRSGVGIDDIEGEGQRVAEGIVFTAVGQGETDIDRSMVKFCQQRLSATNPCRQAVPSEKPCASRIQR